REQRDERPLGRRLQRDAAELDEAAQARADDLGREGERASEGGDRRRELAGGELPQAAAEAPLLGRPGGPLVEADPDAEQRRVGTDLAAEVGAQDGDEAP